MELVDGHPYDVYTALTKDRLIFPRVDAWESFKAPLREFISRYSPWSSVDFDSRDEDELRVFVDGIMTYKLTLRQTDEWPLRIAHYAEGHADHDGFSPFFHEC